MFNEVSLLFNEVPWLFKEVQRSSIKFDECLGSTSVQLGSIFQEDRSDRCGNKRGSRRKVSS